MESYKVIMKHWHTEQSIFLTVEDCKDMDECITHVKEECPEHIIVQISRIK